MKLTALIKLLIEKITQRKLLVLPKQSDPGIFDKRVGVNLLPLKYTYRAFDNNFVTYELQLCGKDLTYILFSMDFSRDCRDQFGQPCLSFNISSVKRGDVLKVSLIEPLVWHNSTPLISILHEHQPTRKFIAKIGLTSERGRLTRLCSHYLPYKNKVIGKDYYFGDDYTDYPLHTNTSRALELVRNYRSVGNLLDIGCAMGIYTKAFLDAGYNAYGIDISQFAIAEAKKLVGADRVRLCNLDKENIPFSHSFKVFWMWDILEHSIDPFRFLEKVTKRAAAGAHLLLHTSNSNSLTHCILGNDWEGYSDYSHYGVDQVSAINLKGWLMDLGWEILKWECGSVWIQGKDPTLRRLQEVFHKVPELATLLSERDLGDAILVIAKKL